MIHRFNENPLIVPNASILWMTENAFNPGVIKDDKGVFHMLIRGGTNRRHQTYGNLGYASSWDGINWAVSKSPVLYYSDYKLANYGLQDPRIVRWNDSFYVFATVQSESICRIGIWQTDNFIDFDFRGIPFEFESKNASIIPELINDRVYLIYRTLPNMWISETKCSDLNDKWTNNQLLLKASDVVLDGLIPLKIAMATPPVKLGGDWLVLFHARFSPIEYRIGFMILDGTNPRNIKYLHPQSILKPELPCEKWGAVPHVCFLTGIVDMGDRWYVYWGAADTVICGGYLLKSDIAV